jgi:hypothetical protein
VGRGEESRSRREDISLFTSPVGRGEESRSRREEISLFTSPFGRGRREAAGEGSLYVMRGNRIFKLLVHRNLLLF